MSRVVDDNSFQIELGILKMESAHYWMNTITPKGNKHNKINKTSHGKKRHRRGNKRIQNKSIYIVRDID